MAFKKAVKGTILAGGGALATVLGLSQFAHYRRKQVSNGVCTDYTINLDQLKNNVWEGLMDMDSRVVTAGAGGGWY